MLQAYIKDDFNSLLEYREWVNQKSANLSQSNTNRAKRLDKNVVEYTIQREPSWFGNNTSFEEMSNGITSYKDHTLIERIFNQVSDRIDAGVRDKVRARKMRYNPNGLGVFIFDRATMGMFRLKEFYEPLSGVKVLEQQVRANGDNFIRITDEAPVLERWEQKPDGRAKIRTTNKNVYAYFPSVSKDRNAVELYVCCGGHSGVTATEFLYSGIPAIVIAQLLEKALIRVKISIVIGTSPDEFKRTTYGAIIPVKNYDERLDLNLLALLTSDPRFYRFEGFKGTLSLYDHFGAVTPSDFGNGYTPEFLKKTIERSSYTKTAKLAPNRFYLGRTFSEKTALEAINETMKELAERFTP